MDSADETQIKKPKLNKSDQNRINFFSQLPPEVSMDILSRLPVSSLVRVSFVCRSLKTQCLDPQLAAMHLSRSRSLPDQNTCLNFHSEYPIQNHLHFLQLHGDDQKVRKVNTPFSMSMPEFKILGSANGLLCLMNSLFSESIFLYNPFTRFYFELPKNYYDIKDGIVVYGFGFHPITNDYKVIKIGCSRRPRGGFNAHYTRQSSQVVVYNMSTNTWKSQETTPYRLEKWSSPGVLVRGRLHWVSQWGRYDGRLGRIIVSYDLVDDSFHGIESPGSSSSSAALGKWVSCHLSALDGHLCAVVPVPPGEGALEVWIMKEYGVNESWIKEYVIGVHYPVSMISDRLDRSSHIWRNMFGMKSVQVLCVLKSGELLLEYRGGGLVSYDAKDRTFKDLVFDGMPRIFRIIVHVGSLVSAANFLS